MKVSLFITCLADQLYPAVGIATVRVLRRLGCEVEFDAAQTCCGQPAWNSGFAAEARAIATSFLSVFDRAQYVVTPSGSCAAMIHHAYETLFEHDEGELARARRVAAKTFELSQFLVRVLGREDVGARFPHTVAYHPSCHATRLLGVRTEPERLLANVRDLELVPLVRAEDCCGFGGTFAVKQGAISSAIAGEKVDHVIESGASHLVGTDMGCLMNISGALRRRGVPVKALHLAQVLESRA